MQSMHWLFEIGLVLIRKWLKLFDSRISSVFVVFWLRMEWWDEKMKGAGRASH